MLLLLLRGELLSEALLDRMLVSQEQLLVALVHQLRAVPWFRRYAALLAAGVASEDGKAALPREAATGAASALDSAVQHATNMLLKASKTGDAGLLRVALARVPASKLDQPDHKPIPIHQCSRYTLKQRSREKPEWRHGWTALHFAAKLGHAHCVQLLVDAGADLDKALKVR